MTDPKTFPSTEPPPHPGDSEAKTPLNPDSPVEVDSNLQNAMEPENISYNDSLETAVNQVNQTTQSAPNPVSTVQPPPVTEFVPKKKPPKILFIIVGAILLMVVIALIGFFFTRESSPTLVGTKGEITWWGIQNSESVVKPFIEQYQERNPNVKINYIQQSEQQYRERLTSALAQGRGPDIFEIHNSWVPMFRNEVSVMPGNIMSSEEYRKTFFPVASKDFLTTEGVVGIPLEYDAITLFYNQDIVDAAAVDIPDTWDGVSQIAKTLTQTGANNVILQAGVGMGLSENVDYWQEIVGLMSVQNGADLSVPDTKTSDAIKFYASFSTDHKVWNSSLPKTVTAFAINKLAILIAPSSAAKNILLENPSIRFRTSKIPQLPKNTPNDPDHTYATYWGQSVGARSRNTEVAWDFLKFLATPQNLQQMNSLRREMGILEKAYPRVDMSILQAEDKILGSVVEMGKYSTSWYLYDKTNDGPTGINSQMNTIYKKLVDVAAQGKDVAKELEDLSAEIKAVLIKYTQKK